MRRHILLAAIIAGLTMAAIPSAAQASAATDLETGKKFFLAGDYEQAQEFVKRWSYWDDKLHGDIAERINSAGGYRRTLIRYGALND